MRATIVTEEPERSRLYALLAAHRPGFAEYEQKTSRKIPVVVLERVEQARTNQENPGIKSIKVQTGALSRSIPTGRLRGSLDAHPRA